MRCPARVSGVAVRRSAARTAVTNSAATAAASAVMPYTPISGAKPASGPSVCG